MSAKSSHGFDSRPESIRRALEKRIIDDALEPGVRLGLKAELQAEFGVAGPTLDQALQLLANDGLITIRRGPGGGVFVARSHPVLRAGTKQLLARDNETVGENIELREALASLLGVSAARPADRDPEVLARLAQLTEELEGSDPLSFDTQRKIWAAHRVLAALSDSATVRFIYTNLLDVAEAVIAEVEIPDTATQRSREQRRINAHCGLFRSVLDGEVDAAHECGQLVRVASQLRRGAHGVAVGEDPPAPLLADVSGSRHPIVDVPDVPGDRDARSLRLGLLGANIAKSMAPAFHMRAGELAGIGISYDLLEHGEDDADRVAALIEGYRAAGYAAINITYPFKERAFAASAVGDANIRAIGAVNTMVLDRPGQDQPPTGFNTDLTGLMRAWRRRWGDRRPGTVGLIGNGGVGRAAAFALAELGATEIRLFDVDAGRSEALQIALRRRFAKIDVVVAPSAESAVDGAAGVVNATPTGAHYSPGSPVEHSAVVSQSWILDVVYTPIETPLVQHATAAGLDVMNGFELFLGQAFDAFERFTSRSLAPPLAAKIESEMWDLVRGTA